MKHSTMQRNGSVFSFRDDTGFKILWNFLWNNWYIILIWKEIGADWITCNLNWLQKFLSKCWYSTSIFH